MDEDDLQSIVSTTDSINSFELLAATEKDTKKNCHLLYNAVASLHTSFYLQVGFYLCNVLQLMWKRKPKCKRQANVHCDRESVIRFIDSWDDEMFKRQFRLSREYFSLLESLILDHKC
jgi:hypothetical protein